MNEGESTMTNSGTRSETNSMSSAHTRPWSKAFWMVLLLAAGLGAVGVAQRIMYGHLLAGYGRTSRGDCGSASISLE